MAAIEARHSLIGRIENKPNTYKCNRCVNEVELVKDEEYLKAPIQGHACHPNRFLLLIRPCKKYFIA